MSYKLEKNKEHLSKKACSNKKIIIIFSIICIIGFIIFTIIIKNINTMENKYKNANIFYESNDYISALLLFNEIEKYKDSLEKKENILKNNEYLKMFISKDGDEIFFGKYEQDNNISNGKEKLEWIIIYNNNNKIYMVSKNIIDAMQYNTANGDGSTLKKWLKESFANDTFDEKEIKLIKHIGLLNKDDMNQYNKIVNTKPNWTNYAMAQNPDKGYYAGYMWWLAGDYFHGFADSDVLMDVVIESGAYSNNSSAVTDKNGVRPAIIIDLNDNNIDYYKDDYNDINNSGIVTRTKTDVDKEVTNILGEDTTKSTHKNNNSDNSGYSKKECPRCKGKGKYRIWNRKEETKCSYCNGKGYVKVDSNGDVWR